MSTLSHIWFSKKKKLNLTTRPSRAHTHTPSYQFHFFLHLTSTFPFPFTGSFIPTISTLLQPNHVKHRWWKYSSEKSKASWVQLGWGRRKTTCKIMAACISTSRVRNQSNKWYFFQSSYRRFPQVSNQEWPHYGPDTRKVCSFLTASVSCCSP